MAADRRSPRILVADDEPDLLRIIKDSLASHGFLVRTAADGAEALAAIRGDPPDVAILDVAMPRKNGFDVCTELRRDPLLEHLPVIFLSASGTRETRVKGLDLGADDFINKPVDIIELLARVRMIIRRSRQGLDANPLTRLPGNVSIENRVEEALERKLPMAVLYIDLNQFKAYNDAYGYDAGDRVIKAMGALLVELLREQGGDDFVGHIGGDDFIVLTSPERMAALAARICRRFDRLVPSFYNEADRARGRILSTDRKGRRVEYPLLSVAIGICHNSLGPLGSYPQVAQLCAEIKKAAKRKTGSAFVIDRRRR
ncbi:MAG: response regulator [Elusimicrobia bacterium]|nr:response regulator [Elusimicrobiota bacterium]MDE2426723.1 response regulator [Elusimicrobiota bacterium]